MRTILDSEPSIKSREPEARAVQPTQLLFRLSPGHIIYVLLRRSLALDLALFMRVCLSLVTAVTSPLLADSSTEALTLFYLGPST